MLFLLSLELLRLYKLHVGKVVSCLIEGKKHQEMIATNMNDDLYF